MKDDIEKPKDEDRTPSFEELQKELSKFLKEKLGNKGMSFVFPQADNSKTKNDNSKEKKPEREIKFDIKPKEVKTYLDRFVIQQDEAKKVLAVAVCDHYHHVAHCLKGSHCAGYAKQNVLLVGPTGVGKTYLVRCIANLIGVPFIKADATKFSETGYVGGDVEDLVRDLVQKADGDVELAQYGIIYLDEADKIAAPSNIVGRDVSGQGVQRGLLKLMEETEVPLRSSTDLTGQIQSMMEFQTKGKIEKKTISTRHILFIMSGAFDGMVDIIKKRIEVKSIGFHANLTPEVYHSDIHRKAITNDYVKFGFDPEFVARLPVKVVLDDLREEDLYRILKNSEDSVIKQYENDFKAYGIKTVFSDEALKTIAHKAATEKTGARGLFTVCEKALREFKYELPSTKIERFVVTTALIDNPAEELKRMLKDTDYIDREFITLQIEYFEEDFSKKHGVKIHFDEKAIEWIFRSLHHNANSVEEYCRDRLKNYEYGLALIRQNTGKEDFEINEDVLDRPKETLDQWIKQSYNVRKRKTS